MNNREDYKLRRANINDVDFLVEVIIQAEMSGTGKCGLAEFYELSEEELRICLRNILLEEVDGCELSISSFVVVEYKNELVAAAGGWREGYNEDNMPSSLLKSNLIAYYIPKENLLKSQQKLSAAKSLHIEREYGTFQLEYSYIKKPHNAILIHSMMINNLIDSAKTQYPDMDKAQSHIFENNKAIVFIDTRVHNFVITERIVSKEEDTLKYFPHNVILLAEKQI